MPRYAFEDFTSGTSRMLGSVTVSKDDIIAFAREYDPQPFHLDEIAAKDSFIGTLVASGWHTCSLNMRLFADGMLLDSTGLGAPGIEEVKWLKPVRPGDTLRSRLTVLETRASKSRPAVGLVHGLFELLNQADEIVMTQTNWVMFARRDAGSFVREDQNTLAAAAPALPDSAPERELPPISANPYFEDLIVGETEDLGSHTFQADEIIRFAKQFDPQRFHVDAEAARDSLFGALCASGWHTASVCMKLMIAARNRTRSDALAHGGRPARLGPSPGFTNMKWLKPVYAGDTIHYRTTISGKRPSNTHRGWGLAFQHNVGVNQHGEEVFSFDAALFWERRA
jgi:acyl dehydratase